jgi:hypothetical protein
MIPLLLLALLLTLLLSGCVGRSLLANVQADATMLNPTGQDEAEAININYTIGCNANVSVYLEESDSGTQYYLRQNEPRHPSSDPYTLRFDGTVPTSDAVVQRRLLPDGNYTAVIQATSDECGSDTARVPITVTGSDEPLPDIENLTVWPESISPNADAINDVAEITYRLPVTATIDLTITTPAGHTLPLISRERQEAQEWSHVWNGKHPDGSLLQDGVYTCTVTAEDRYGNLVRRQELVTLVDVGEPEATITYARIAPARVMLGDMITITMRVKNTGTVPIRTYGPPSGFTYTTNEVFSSVAGGKYTSHAGGFWRIGVDWDANSGDGPKRYPFRWALSQRPPDEWKIPGKEDWLLPGEEVEVIGNVVVLQRETKMGFYVGLIQDGVGFFQNRTARTIVEVGF